MPANWRRWRLFIDSIPVLSIAVLIVVAASARAEGPAAPTAAPAKAADAAKENTFIRVTHDAKDQPVALETAIVHYVAKDGSDLTVDLIGAVHVADKGYYEKLNKQFEKYDAMLYELVADKGARPQPGEKGHSAISSIQIAMKNILELDFQLDDIDYTKKNFVHADMSPEEFAKSMAAKGESIWTIMFKMMAAGMAQQAGRDDLSDFDLITALFDKNRAVQLKRFMAVQMEDMEGVMAGFEGPAGSTLITERNKAALKVLDVQIKSGKKKLAIFYGAGHLGDMEKRLADDFGLKRADEQWLEAWNLRLPAEAAKPAAPANVTPAKTGK